jgi:predicted dehydrogenase
MLDLPRAFFQQEIDMENTPPRDNPSQDASRRDFLKSSAATVVGATAAYLSTVPHVHAGGSDFLGVGLIGCGSPRGGRGRGAAENCVKAGPNVKLIAMGDLFKDHLEFSRNNLKKLGPSLVDVPDKNCFVGWDAYKDVIHCKGVDVVILATPPGFRPLHLKEAVAAGKHIFCEKPVAVDAPGIRSVLKTVEEAKKKNLALVSGLCWRYDHGMREAFKRVHGGAIGDIVSMQCTYNTGGLWMVPRDSKWSDMEWQVRNWLYFTWLSGDFNVEQHVHSLDKMAWIMQETPPLKAVGLGGRQVRTGSDYGHIFDHHSVVYDYPGSIKMYSNCRQQEGCAQDVSDHIFGTKGVCHIDASRARFFIKSYDKGQKTWLYRKPQGSKDRGMYQNEHDELIASIRAGKPINNGEYMTKSSMLAILGRMATYTGLEITWEKALRSKQDLMPAKLEMGSLPTPEVARPGVTKFV